MWLPNSLKLRTKLSFNNKIYLLSSISSLLGVGSPFHTCNALQHISLPTDCSYELVNTGQVWLVAELPNLNCEVIFRPLIFFPRVDTSSLKIYYSKLNRAEKKYLKFILLTLNRINLGLRAALAVLKQASFAFSPINRMQLSASISRGDGYVAVDIQGARPDLEDIMRYKNFCETWEATKLAAPKVEPEQSICAIKQ